MAKRQLNNLYHLSAEINELLCDIEKLETKAMKVTGYSDGQPKGNATTDKVGNNAVKIADLKSLLDEKLDQVCIEKGELLKKIYKIQDSDLRRILRERYINLKSFEEIAVIMRYSYRHILRLHGQALKEYEKVGMTCHMEK